jgi:predicted amidohydrolase
MADASMNHCISVAAFQGASTDGDVEFNLSKIKEQMCKASSVGAELLIFPELFLSGYRVPAEEMKMVAEERDGPSFQELSKTARECNIAVLYGYPEVDRSSGTSVYYNSAQLIDRDGSSLVNYHKTHLWIDAEGFEKVFQAGDSLCEVVECCNVKIGVLICFDMELPECARTLAIKGAQLIAIPTAIGRQLPTDVQEKIPTLVVPTRAAENRVHIVCVNHGGEQFSGQSTCYNPIGDVVIQVGSGEHLLLFSINPSIQLPYNYLNCRKPHLYTFQ